MCKVIAIVNQKRWSSKDYDNSELRYRFGKRRQEGTTYRCG